MRVYSDRGGERSRRPREADRPNGRLRPGADGHTGTDMHAVFVYTHTNTVYYCIYKQVCMNVSLGSQSFYLHLYTE